MKSDKKTSAPRQRPDAALKPSASDQTAGHSPGGTLQRWVRKNLATIIVLLISAGIFAAAFVISHDETTGQIHAPKSSVYDTLSFETAEILNISKDTVDYERSVNDEVYVGSQTMLIRLTSGAHAGETYEIENFVSTFSNLPFKVGDSIVLYQYVDADTGEIRINSSTGSAELYVYEYNRTPALYIILGAFFLITILVGGKTGLKSFIGLVITVICLIFILCPLLMKGYPVVATTFVICAYVAIVSFVILGGVNRKTVCAICGTAAGMGLAALFGTIAQGISRITSYSMYDGQNLLDEFKNWQQGGLPFHISGLLTAGILISSLGAVMDVAMSLSSSISELKAVNPSMTQKELWKSAMNIGRDMVGTMTNTLILALVGSSLVIIIYYWSLDLSFKQFVNNSYITTEYISAVSSSIGVILAVPVTAVIGAIFFGNKHVRS